DNFRGGPIRFTPKSGHWNVVAICPLTLCQKRTFASSIRSPITSGALRLPGRSDLGRPHWFRHAEEDHDALTAAARRERLGGVSEANVHVLPVVHHPHVARG